MPKQIVTYFLEGNGTVPLWIENGGYFPDYNGKMVGLTVDSDRFNVPYGLTVLSKSDIIARAQLVMNDDQRPPQPFSSQMATDYVNNWLAWIGMPDYV